MKLTIIYDGFNDELESALAVVLERVGYEFVASEYDVTNAKRSLDFEMEG